MKRIDLRHLQKHGCELAREGAQHALYINRQTRKSAAVPDIVKFPPARLEVFVEPSEQFPRCDDSLH